MDINKKNSTRDEGPLTNHIIAGSSLSPKTNKTEISKNFFSQSFFNSEDSLPVTQPEQHHADDSISTEVSSFIDSYNTAPNEPLKNQENIENQKKEKLQLLLNLSDQSGQPTQLNTTEFNLL
ncbi:unnamed protein product [[Candida] boidinii]|nr:unnamed protein product [[Candida] boidinii]